MFDEFENQRIFLVEQLAAVYLLLDTPFHLPLLVPYLLNYSFDAFMDR